MDIRKIKKMIELLEESGIAEIEIKEGEETVRIAACRPAAPCCMPCRTCARRSWPRRCRPQPPRSPAAPAAESAAQGALQRAHGHRADGRHLLCRPDAGRQAVRRDRR